MKTSILSLVLFVVLLAACAAPAQPAAGHYAGQVSGSDAFIGIVIHGEQLQAYFCDGTQESAPRLWGWFRGALDGNRFDLINANGDRLTGEFAATNASEAIVLTDGTTLTFQAVPVDKPAGLYRHEETIDGVDTLAGWIVLSNGHWRGGRKTGAQLTVTPGKPVSWVDPDTEPWVEPDTQP